jgi:hypothetical protein
MRVPLAIRWRLHCQNRELVRATVVSGPTYVLADGQPDQRCPDWAEDGEISFSDVGISRKHQLAFANVHPVNLKLYDAIHTHDRGRNLMFCNDIRPFELSQQSASYQIEWISGEQARDNIRECRFFIFGKNDGRHRVRHSVHGSSISGWNTTSVRAARKHAGCALYIVG